MHYMEGKLKLATFVWPCFSCIPLRLGALIVAIGSLVLHIVPLIGSIILVAVGAAVSTDARFVLSHFPELLEEYTTLRRAYFGISITTLVTCLIDIVVCSLLIYGIQKSKRQLFLPYVVCSGFNILVSLIMYFVLLGLANNFARGVRAAGIRHDSISTSDNTSFVFTVLTYLFGIYAILVIIAYYQELGEGAGQGVGVGEQVPKDVDDGNGGNKGKN